MLLYDFALGRYLNKTQPFAVTFDSMIALALFKHGIDFRYSAAMGCYVLPQTGEMIFPAPFQNKEMFENRIKTIIKGKKTGTGYIVTISERYSFFHGEIRFEALPFYEWSILSEKDTLQNT
jgi:hypothetical protein